jgi:hypothetical protein
VHVGDVQPRDLARTVEDQRRLLGVVGVDVDLQRRVVTDDQDRVADHLQLGHIARRFQPLTGDGEVGAVAIGLARVLGMGDPRGRVVVELRRVGALQGGDDPGEDDDDAVATGVDDARLAQGGQQLGPALDRRLAGDDRPLQRGGDQQVLLLGLGGGREAALVLGQMREVMGDRGRHVAHHREHRALGRVAHGRVGPLGGSRERRTEQDGIDQLAGARDQLLGGAADQLGEDDAAIAARTEQGGASDRLDDLIAADLIDRAVMEQREAIELGEHRLERERHVVARVAVSDREDVEIVDLLTAGLEVRERALDRHAKADETRIGHRCDRSASRG